MKISKSEPNYVFFENVKCGDVFLYEGNYYIKLADVLYSVDDRNGYNCVMMSDGDVNYVEEGERVELINGEFKIY